MFWFLLIITNVYLYWKLRLGFGSGSWRVVYLIWTLLWIAAPFVLRTGYFGARRTTEIIYGLAFTWIAVIGIACVVFFFVDMGLLAARLTARLSGANLNPVFFDSRKNVPATLLLILAVVVYSYYEAWDVKRVDLVIETPKLQ